MPSNELTFEQWLSDTRAYQRQFPEFVLLPAVRKSIQGRAKSVLRNMGPEYTIDQAIKVLTREYEGVANSDVVFKEFYQLKQEKNEKVQVFSVRLREALNKLTLRFPDRVPSGDEDRILCDRFFYGMKAELKSSVRHLFDSPDVSFSTLLTAARRNELEEIEQKPVRIQSKAAKAGVVEKVSPQTESINDLKEQIQELATVMKSGSANHKPNPPAVNGGQAKKFKKANQKQKKTDVREGLAGPAANALGPFPPGQRPLQCHKCKGWGHVRRVCPLRLNFTRGECKTEPSSPRTGVCRGTGSACTEDPIVAKAVKMADRYHNPDPLIRSIGPVNESMVILEGKEYPTLLDSGAQPSGISLKLARKLGLKIYQLDTLLDIEGFGGNDVPYLGYVEARLQVKGISGMDEDSLFLVVPDSNYTRRVLISIGTVHIERCLQLLKEGEITKLPDSWERAIFPKHILKKDKIIDPDFNLESVEGKIKLPKRVVLKPFETVLVSGISGSKLHRKRVNVMIDRVEGSLGDDVVPVNSYSILYPGSSRAKMALRNMTPREIVLKAKTCVARMAAANVVPHMLAPKIVGDSEDKAQKKPVGGKGEEVKLAPLSPEQQEKLKSKLDLTGINDWSQEDKKAVEELFQEYGGLFALDKNYLGHTTRVKHKIKLNDYTPFKERYRRVPPHLYEEV